MIALIVSIQMKPEFREQFIEEMLLDARGSLENEPGCRQFDVLIDEADPNCLHLFEVYDDQQAIEYHIQTPHFVRWRNATQDWLAAPPQIARATHLFPADRVGRFK